MTSHPNRVPCIEVNKHVESGAWDWMCWGDHSERADRWFGTEGNQQDALAAALEHCAKATS